MLIRIARHEWHVIIRERRLWWLAAGLLALTALSGAGGITRQRAVVADRADAVTLDRTAWLSQPARNAHAASHYGGFAIKDVSPLALLDPGVEPYTGSVVRIEAHRQGEALFSPAREAGGILRFGLLTPSMVLQTLMPLLVIFAGFALVCDEREHGTLALVCAQGISVRRLVLGKFVALLALSWGMAAPVLVMSVALLGLAGTPLLMDDVLRLIVWVVLHLLYLAAVAACTVAVSARAPSGRAALTVLLAGWTVCVLLLPKGAANIGAGWHPLPSRAAFDERVARDIAEGIDGHTPDLARRRVIEQEALRRYGVSRVEDLPVNLDGLIHEASEAYSTDVYVRHFSALQQTIAQQNRLSGLVSAVNPFVAIRALSMAVVGTDYTHHVAFHLAAEAYRRRMVTAMNAWLTYETRTGDWESPADVSLWASVPQFAYERPSLRQAVQARVVAAGGLVLCLVAAGTWLIASARRAPVVASA